MMVETNRCGWRGMAGDPLYEAYHDTEWGVPEWDSRALWEKLVLDFLWDFVGGAPIANTFAAIGDVPVKTPEAEAMAKALKAKGFKYCGPVIVYAFMQATGMVNDHETGCCRHHDVAQLGKK